MTPDHRATRRARQDPDSGLGGAWRVIVRNDDHNTFDHVAHTLARYIPGISVDAGLRDRRPDPQHRPGDRLERPQGAGRALLGAAARRGPHDGPARAGLSARWRATARPVRPYADSGMADARGAHRDGARAAREQDLLRRYHEGGDTRGARPARRGDAAARPRAGRPLRRPRRADRRPRAGRLRRDHEGHRGLRPDARGALLVRTRRRPCWARSSATSATGPGRCASRAACRSCSSRSPRRATS